MPCSHWKFWKRVKIVKVLVVSQECQNVSILINWFLSWPILLVVFRYPWGREEHGIFPCRYLCIGFFFFLIGLLLLCYIVWVSYNFQSCTCMHQRFCNLFWSRVLFHHDKSLEIDVCQRLDFVWFWRWGDYIEDLCHCVDEILDGNAGSGQQAWRKGYWDGESILIIMVDKDGRKSRIWWSLRKGRRKTKWIITMAFWASPKWLR